MCKQVQRYLTGEALDNVGMVTETLHTIKTLATSSSAHRARLNQIGEPRYPSNCTTQHGGIATSFLGYKHQI